MIILKDFTAKVAEEGIRKTILSDVDLTFVPGKIYAVMGPNGSGKSTLARTIMGDPAFKLASKSTLKLIEGEGEKAKTHNLKNRAPNERAELGIFLSMQSPLEIAGVTVFGLLRAATKNREQFAGMSAKDLKNKIDETAQDLHIEPELLKRSLNEGLSGGERKKIEVLQMAILDPKYILLDEIDTGVDVDALKTIAKFLKKFVKGTDKTIIMITHYNRILKYLKPDTTIVIKDGKLAKTGTAELAKKIEKQGFEKI